MVGILNVLISRGVTERLINLPVVIRWKVAGVRFRLSLDPLLLTTDTAWGPGGMA